MTEGGYYQVQRPRKTSIAIVVLLHGAVFTAVVLSKMNVIVAPRTGPIEVEFIKNPPPPPPVDPEVKLKPPMPTNIPVNDTIIDIDTLPPKGPTATTVDPIPASGFDTVEGSGSGPKVDPVPPPEPVRIGARIDSRSALQPPYPASEQRAGAEGLVSLRVVIGPDGRVKATEKVQATSEAFYQATVRHALRNWRFTPATIDGRPVESRKVMTVRFTLDG